MIAAVHVIDVYLDEKHEAERNHIRQLAGSQDSSSTEVLRGYVREAMRWFHLASLCDMMLTTILFRPQPAIHRSLA